MKHNSQILKSLNGTWIDELLSISDEEIKKVINNLPDFKTKKPKIEPVKSKSKSNSVKRKPKRIFTKKENDQEVTFPRLLGRMSDFEKAAFTLLKKKQAEYDQISKMQQTSKTKNSSFQLGMTKRLISLIERHISYSIHSRRLVIPKSTTDIVFSKGGDIFAINRDLKKREKPVSQDEEIQDFLVSLAVEGFGETDPTYVPVIFGLVS